jgi:transcriptional regulator with XRE-family HTH domain
MIIMPKHRTNQSIGQKKINLAHIGERVLLLRKGFHLTQKELGEILGVTGPSVLAAERTSGPLVMEAIIFFAETFHVNPSWVILKDNTDIPKFIERRVGKKPFDLTDMDLSINAPGVIAEKIKMQVMLLLKSVDKIMDLKRNEKLTVNEYTKQPPKKSINKKIKKLNRE